MICSRHVTRISLVPGAQVRFDFFYLPVDFRNGGNLGYCFINLLTPADIPPFCAEFNQRKWDMINSEKICEILRKPVLCMNCKKPEKTGRRN